MYIGQPEKYISTVFTFGERGTINASKTIVVNAYFAAIGGSYGTIPGPTLAVVIPRNGMLKNLSWSADSSALTAAGNRIIVYVNTTPTGLAHTWTGNIKSGFNGTAVPVVAGDSVSVQIQLAKSTAVVGISQPRVSFELEVDAQEPNPWDLTGSTVSYTGGK